MSDETYRPWVKHYDQHVKNDLDYPSIPLFGYLDRAAEKYPRRNAIIFKNYKLTYAKLKVMAEKIAASLRAQGVRTGDRVAIMLPNLPQTVITYWGILKAGAVVVMTNPLYMEKELIHQLNDAGVKHLVTLDLLWSKLGPLRDQIPVEKFHITSIPEGLRFPLNKLASFKLREQRKGLKIPYDRESVLRWNRLLKTKKQYSHPNIMPHSDLALLQYTGGTTGISKGCMLTHSNLIANVTQMQCLLHNIGQKRETFLSVLPFFHVYGLTVGLNFPTSVAATVAPFPKYEPAELLKSIGKIKPTIFPGAPSVYISLMQQKTFRKTDFKALEYLISGSAPMPMDVMQRFEEATGARIVEGYGLTEASPVTHLNPLHGMRKAGTIGIPFPDTEARIVDMEVGGLPLPPGKQGELILKGPQVMKGYWNRPDETANTLRNGWLYTGDVATMDEDGYFTIVDRKKDLIISAGYNIYPREIDEVLFEHPKIKEAVVVGIPNKTRGEIIKAYIVLNEGEIMDRAEVIAYCKEKLAHYKVPRKVEFRKELPKTLVGKVLRRALREEEERKKKRS